MKLRATVVVDVPKGYDPLEAAETGLHTAFTRIFEAIAIDKRNSFDITDKGEFAKLMTHRFAHYSGVVRVSLLEA
jgi:hypothetical protein